MEIPKISQNTKKLTLIILGLLIILLLLIVIISSSIKGDHNKRCKELYNNVSQYTDGYMTLNQLYPVINGDSYTLSLDDIEGTIYFGDNEVSGTVTYTKYNDQTIKTFELENCKYCEADWEDETEKYNEKAINVDVIPYFNYYDVSYYNSKWSEWINFDDINVEPTDGVNLPLNSKDLPKIPESAIIEEIVKEDTLYYRYRDSKWKFYKNNIPYSGLSSEQPIGYTNKDNATETLTEVTDWSMDYPEEKEYRTINSKTAYRWYYEENGEKIYWNDGQYWPEQPDNKYTEKSKEKVTMYRYYDKMWKWYNGNTKRQYSSYMTTGTSSYIYKDEDLVDYTDWSKYYPTSQVNSNNSSYRVEEVKTHSRYLIKYKMLSLLKFDEYKTKQELQIETGKTLYQLATDKSIQIDVNFKFRY